MGLIPPKLPQRIGKKPRPCFTPLCLFVDLLNSFSVYVDESLSFFISLLFSSSSWLYRLYANISIWNLARWNCYLDFNFLVYKAWNDKMITSKSKHSIKFVNCLIEAIKYKHILNKFPGSIFWNSFLLMKFLMIVWKATTFIHFYFCSKFLFKLRHNSDSTYPTVVFASGTISHSPLKTYIDRSTCERNLNLEIWPFLDISYPCVLTFSTFLDLSYINQIPRDILLRF